eukprot:Seg6949.1 transcript_id=Seg6949.1/GoldUCD/mRNA.D3Y31 product="hypothetical protein" protein_id=Seg6949.1/GoldUCD/D3Y31
MLILGDLNCDLLKRNGSSELGQQGKRLRRMLNKYGLANIIKEPTRIIDTSETLIDLIVTSDESKIVKGGSFDPGMSDHKLVYSVLNLRRKRLLPQLKTVKNYKGINIEAFQKALENTPWWISSVFYEVGDKLNTWELLYKNVVNEYVKTRKAKVRKDSLPWMTTALRKLLNKRYKLLRAWQQGKNETNNDKYKKARNLAKKEIRNAGGKLLEN